MNNEVLKLWLDYSLSNSQPSPLFELVATKKEFNNSMIFWLDSCLAYHLINNNEVGKKWVL